ncbi:putative MFS transporter [Aspergillus clavatus NRRL 1]|uniref:MFS transporter, putative n=1 Tax=Aspergillus clavatus (strain ATCC 1007 / CBS 513.65 / DSM 816 / NCTC 3887 / NRRL 1 / QM 1276 / 107) TaxID=344612 RepID=A1C716_ASPCL|nr:MFS transporter, putative [Aspergillus clavatus NRRL 1]EAW14187.1 MFS transporter, putative [Aspergillus clavatus NRRL 1]
MTGSSHQSRRLISVIAATLTALACGTNYAYSAWEPQFADGMKLSSTESNLIGVAGNLGMYASGIPLGLLTDARGPRLTTFLGAITLGFGYFPIYQAYENGQGSLGVPMLCFFAFFTGFGSCSSFSASIKTAASNFPDHRGTATAFPLAAFGLSALFWSTVSAIAFKDDTGKFLLLLTLGTLFLNLIAIPFLRILPPSGSYHRLPNQRESTVESRQLRAARSTDPRSYQEDPDEAGTQSFGVFESQTGAHSRSTSHASNSHHSLANDPDADETSSLVSKPASRLSRDTLDGCNTDEILSNVPIDLPHPDVRGLAMLPKIEFWQLFLTMALLSGIGLMTINNIGNTAKALWKHYDDSASPRFIHQRQVMHVSILSFGNFIGRLLSGIGSDLLVKKLNMSRFWCLLISATVFTATQLAGAAISNPHQLVVVSGFTGFAYGFLFGVFPSLVAHTFGIGGLSQNWGVMTLAPVVSGNLFNLLYGSTFDKNSIVGPDGERDCPDGLGCYQRAYYTTFFSGVAGIIVCLWSIWSENRIHKKVLHKKLEHERLA